jgi:hypothetical protein
MVRDTLVAVALVVLTVAVYGMARGLSVGITTHWFSQCFSARP